MFRLNGNEFSFLLLFYCFIAKIYVIKDFLKYSHREKCCFHLNLMVMFLSRGSTRNVLITLFGKILRKEFFICKVGI